MNNRTVLGLIVGLATFAILLLLSNNANPDSPLFGLKRIQEKIFLSLSFGKDTELAYLNRLLDKRLVELKSLANKEKSYYLRSASLRYTTTMGQIVELIKKHNLKDQIPPTVEKIQSYKSEIKIALDNMPEDFSNEDWKFLEDAINYSNLYIEELSK